MALGRVRRGPFSRCVAGALLLAGSALWEPAGAQYGGFGFPFLGNPWFNQRSAWVPRHRELPRYRQPRDREPMSVATPPPPHNSDAAPAKTGMVIGDSMAEWLAYGLEEAYAESTDIGVVRKVRRSTGLIDRCKGELPKWLEQSLANAKPAFIAIMIGMNDRRSMQACLPPDKGDTAKQSIHAFRSKGWTQAYGNEVDEILSLLKSKSVPVFWVGLPPAKNIRAADIGFLNDVFREHAEKGEIDYIDVWDAFIDEDGDFTMRGPDVNGQMRPLRAADGLNFTKAGARKLALNLERGISRTLLQPAPIEPPIATKETGRTPTKSNERPTEGPLIPLTGEPLRADVLLGAARAAPSDARLLDGQPPTPTPGRDFIWPRSQEAPALVPEGSGYAQDNSDVAPKSGRSAPRASSRKSRENTR